MLSRVSGSRLWALCLASCATRVIGTAPTVTLDQGVYIGTTTQLATATPIVNKFYGIPFSDKVERFSPPAPPPSSNQVTVVDKLLPVCWEQINFPPAEHDLVTKIFDNPFSEKSEDCLNLNVFVPAENNGSLPVMLWWFPGAFQFGGGTIEAWDGSSFAAKQDVIVVSPNQRLSVFGFPGAPPDVPEESQNLGLQDFHSSLDWVQENIEKFGGDPTRVTLFGESSGSVAIDYVLISEKQREKPRFHAAIMESGTSLISPSTGFDWSLLEPTPFTPPWPALALSLGCIGDSTAVFECVKNAPAEKVQYIIERERLAFPVVVNDNKTVFSDGLDRRLSGDVVDVPIMLGSNSQEFQLFIAIGLVAYIPSLNPIDALSQFAQLLASFLPDPQYQAIAMDNYPTSNLDFLALTEVLDQITTDITFNCPAQLVANASANAGIKTWRYLYNASWPDIKPFKNAGCFHVSEIPLVFNMFLPGIAQPEVGPTADEIALSEFMQTAWATFAKDPQNGPGWDEYAPSGVQTFGVLGGPNPVGVANQDVSENDQFCPAWDEVIKIFGSLPIKQ